jgi:hypothetical protein
MFVANVHRSLQVILIVLFLCSEGMRISYMNSAFPIEKANAGETYKTNLIENNLIENKGKKLMIEENTNSEINSENVAESDIKFNAGIEFSEDKLIVNYELTNKSNTDIYVLDVLPVYDLETKKPHVDLNNSVIIWDEPDAVKIIRGLPPYPREKDMAVFITPQASKIAVKQSLKRTIELPLPLVEASPYYKPLERERYEPVKIKTLKLYVHIIRSNVEGFEAAPVSFGKDIFHIRSKYLIAQVEKFYKEFSVKEVELLKYPETFTRTI